MIRPRRVLEILAFPLGVFAAAWAGAWIAQYTGMILPHGVNFDMWLMDHPLLERLNAEFSFAMFAVLAGICVAIATYVFLKFSPQGGPWWGVHLHLASLLYLYAVVAIVAYVRCWGECDGPAIGMIRASGLAALGGAVGNATLVRRLSLRAHGA